MYIKEFIMILILFLLSNVNASTTNVIIHPEKIYTIDSASILWDGGSLLVKMTASNSSINVIFKTSKIKNSLKNRILISNDNSKPVLLDEKSSEYLYKSISHSKISRKAFEEIMHYLRENSEEPLTFALVYNFVARIFEYPLIGEFENNKAMTSISERKKLLENIISKSNNSLKIISEQPK
jgi:hypothetical protein